MQIYIYYVYFDFGDGKGKAIDMQTPKSMNNWNESEIHG